MTASDLTSEPLELDARAGDGLDVRLFWHPATGQVTLSLFDSTQEQALEFAVDPAKALDAFHHPFAYAASCGIPYTASLRAYDAQPITA